MLPISPITSSLAARPITSVFLRPPVTPQTSLPAKPVFPREIHQLRAQGLSVSQVAQRLGISRAEVIKNDAAYAPSVSASLGRTINTIA